MCFKQIKKIKIHLPRLTTRLSLESSMELEAKFADTPFSLGVCLSDITARYLNSSPYFNAIGEIDKGENTTFSKEERVLLVCTSGSTKTKGRINIRKDPLYQPTLITPGISFWVRANALANYDEFLRLSGKFPKRNKSSSPTERFTSTSKQHLKRKEGLRTDTEVRQQLNKLNQNSLINDIFLWG